MNSKIQRMSSAKTENPCSSTYLHPLNVDIVLGFVFTYLEEHQKDDLLKYRLVCHKWNDVIVRMVNKSGRSFRIPLRYGSEVPLRIERCDAEQWTKETLRQVISILTGTAGRLQFDTLLIDREFFLGWFILEWTHFLELHGKSIRHLKLNIRPEEFPMTPDQQVSVTDCEEIMSMANLRKIFLLSPNLESLEFCVRFSGNAATQSMFPAGDIPQLRKLTKITIREPHGYSYTRTLLVEILSMTSNLTDLYLKPWNQLTIFSSAMSASAVESKIVSLTSLQISHAEFPNSLLRLNEEGWLQFSYLHLTTLEIDSGSSQWIQTVLRLQQSSLVNLVLGNRNDDMLRRWRSWVTFPTVMEHLRKLEINLLKFRVSWMETYETGFPVLERLSLTGRGNEDPWTWIHLSRLLPGVTGRGTSVKEFTLIGPRDGEDKARITQGVRDTFPTAQSHFDD